MRKKADWGAVHERSTEAPEHGTEPVFPTSTREEKVANGKEGQARERERNRGVERAGAALISENLQFASGVDREENRRIACAVGLSDPVSCRGCGSAGGVLRRSRNDGRTSNRRSACRAAFGISLRQECDTLRRSLLVLGAPAGSQIPLGIVQRFPHEPGHLLCPSRITPV